MTAKSPSVLVAAIGESHQLLHVLGPARELHKLGVRTHLLVSTHWHEQIIAAHAPELSGLIIRTPLVYTDRPLHVCPPRAPNIFLSRNIFAAFDGVLTPERTSTMLKTLLGKRCPKLIHIPHGTGDRAKSVARRISAFDLILTAGDKYRDEFIARGIGTPENCHVVGYTKFDVLGDAPPRFFGNDNPIVLYNPHFDDPLSSWPLMGEALVRGFGELSGFNVIIAPHVRMRGKSRRLFDHLAATAGRPNLRFDGGSIHSINMDYTRAADIYVGDISSQVYEFLQTPKPCVFADAHVRDWHNDVHYKHWYYGEVGRTAEEVIAFVRTAIADHARFRGAQTAGFNATISGDHPEASVNAARLIRDYLNA